MTLPVVLRPEAAQDLQEARSWYDGRQAGFGDTFARRAADAIDAVGRMPELYGLVWQDVRAATIRRHPRVIYYRSLADRVEGFAVLHARRDPAEWQGRV